MDPASGAPWRQLGPLAVLVLAAHLALLQGGPRRVSPAPAPPVPFATRSIAPEPAAARSRALDPRLRGDDGPAARPAAPTPQRAKPREPPAPAPPAEPAAPAPAAPAAVPAPEQAPPPAAAPPAAAPPAAAPPAVALPPPVRLHYEVSVRKGPLSLPGRAFLDWRHDGREYEARLEASGLGAARVQRSTGRIGPEGLVPSYFSDKARSEQATHFDRANGRLVFSNNRPDAALAEGMQDRLSVLVQLAALVAGQPANYPPGTQVAIPTASAREADTWVFAVEGEEELALPGGAVRALKLQRLPRREYDQKVELWLAPRMDYAPVRLRLTNPNGDTVDNRWSSTDRG